MILKYALLIRTCILYFLFQGLENSWANHKKCAEMLHEGLEKLGLELLVKDKVSRRSPSRISRVASNGPFVRRVISNGPSKHAQSC